jgi:HEPN domain-containing protein
MKKDTEAWLAYAGENLVSAEILLQSNLFNPCLQNLQQSVEKFLKAVLIEKAAGLTRTHSIRQLSNSISDLGMTITISDDDIDLLDSIYLPSKYPAFSVLPKFIPDEEICRQCLTVALAVKSDVFQFLTVASIS